MLYTVLFFHIIQSAVKLVRRMDGYQFAIIQKLLALFYTMIKVPRVGHRELCKRFSEIWTEQGIHGSPTATSRTVTGTVRRSTSTGTMLTTATRITALVRKFLERTELTLLFSLSNQASHLSFFQSLPTFLKCGCNYSR